MRSRKPRDIFLNRLFAFPCQLLLKSRNLRLNRQNNSYLTDLEQSLTENCSLRQKDSKKLVLKHKVFSFLQKCTSRPAVSLKSGNFNNNDIAK